MGYGVVGDGGDGFYCFVKKDVLVVNGGIVFVVLKGGVWVLVY